MAPAPALASGTITVTNNEQASDENSTKEVYTAWQIFDAVKDSSDPNNVTYKISSSDPWFSVLFDTSGSTPTPVSGNVWFTTINPIPGEPGVYQVIPASDYTTEAKAKAAAEWLYAHKGNIQPQTLTVGSNTVDDGYYLVHSTLGSNLGLATSDFGMEINEKNTWPSIDKKQKDEDANAYGDSVVDVAVNDYIDYEIVVYVPPTADKDLTITDTMSDGLTYDATQGTTAKVGTTAAAAWTSNLVKDDGNTANPDYTVNESNGTLTSIVIHPTTSTKGKYVSIRFRAQVNEDAIVTDTDKENEAQLTYSNYTQTDTVNYETNATGAQKYDGATATVNSSNNTLSKTSTASAIKYLADATFKLQVSDDNGSTWTDVPVVKVTDATNGDYYRPAVSGETAVDIVTATANGENGKFVIRGLDTDKQYQLVETAAPDGYNLLTSPSALALSPNNESTTGKPVITDSNVPETSIVKIANVGGVILPTTGGIGTTVLYAAGAALVIGGGAFLLTKTRASKGAEESGSEE